MTGTLRPSNDEFYIGYEDRMPAGIAKRVAGAVALFASAALIGIAVALVAQQKLAPSRFEFGIVKPVTGVLRRAPYPSLEVDGRRVWLVGPGKFGADTVLGNASAGPVTVEGSAIERGRNRMLELVRFRGRSDPGQTALGDHAQRTFDDVMLTGEIVDSKCFLGVMNPGEGTVHRDCARRCISGGIPPMLLVHDGGLREELILLVTAKGAPIGRKLARMAGYPVTVTGRLARDEEVWVLYADPEAYRPTDSVQ